MFRTRLLLSYLTASIVACGSSADAAVLRRSVLGCATAGDAARVAALTAQRDVSALDAFSAPLLAKRSCITFAKGITVDVDEQRLPLSCIRLTGDLSCYWVPDALVDQFPSEGSAGTGHKGGGRHH